MEIIWIITHIVAWGAGLITGMYFASQIEKDIDEDKKLSKETFRELKQLVKSITSSQEEYAEKFGKKTIIIH